MIESGRGPTRGRMTGSTIRAILTVVMIILGMAGITISRGPLVNIVDMATRTGHLGVFASQFEGRQVVIKSCGQPAAGRMAGPAIRAELTVVVIIFSMTGITIGRGAFIDIVDVTTGTRHLDVFTRQFESGHVMVKGRRQPATRRMAVPTVCAKQGRVRVALFMTGSTIRGRTLEDTIYMAVDTCNINMFSR
jgi:hypothetical protein